MKVNRIKNQFSKVKSQDDTLAIVYMGKLNAVSCVLNVRYVVH